MTYAFTGFAALADPTRRRVFELVAESPRSVAELARSLPVSQPAVSQHLKVLRAAQLVRSETSGARHVYHVDPHGVGLMRAWLDRMWTDALESFRAEIEAEKGEVR
jgi:DNA-binding transcriptional ArsR family regulator